MKIAINRCYGGFELSMKAVSRLAELEGKKAYFFKHESEKYSPITEEKEAGLCWFAFDIPNPNQLLKNCSGEAWTKMSTEKRIAANKLHEQHNLTLGRDVERTNPLLIQVIEELGEEANGRFAKIDIIEIPNDVEWEIDEYDGIETVHEVHRSWS